jgi:acid stress-induced BolA-like protein IbaG/YrbA
LALSVIIYQKLKVKEHGTFGSELSFKGMVVLEQYFLKHELKKHQKLYAAKIAAVVIVFIHELYY